MSGKMRMYGSPTYMQSIVDCKHHYAADTCIRVRYSFLVSCIFVKVGQHRIYIKPMNYKNSVKSSKFVCYIATKISCETEILLMSQLVLTRQFIVGRLQPVNTKLNL
jgi:hypothetical protein